MNRLGEHDPPANFGSANMSTDVVAMYESAVAAEQAIEGGIAAYVAELTAGGNPGVS